MTVVQFALHARDIPVLGDDAVTEADHAYGHLAQTDPVLRSLVERFGHPDPFGRREEAGRGDHFAAVVRYVTLRPLHAPPTSILYASLRRATRGHPSAARIVALGVRRLTALGLPADDAARVVRLGHAQLSGEVDLATVAGRNDRQVRELLAGYGFPRRVADLFLIRRLGRPDVLPVDDPALAQVVSDIWAGPVDVIGLAWAPYRTYAAALLQAFAREMAHAADRTPR
ncbi:hypothetical protein [Amycolatopsis sp. FDAARGOS 1241]|uniref:hypothetical protein n=1 Tax=Amycolatopsis sp. FDAARGOS 1241 TaxID=2778070 RepID=UPI001EF175A7|nr:hypothetical protein [Amycolatopsis sp. FDAARGOS 1241]